MTVVIVQCRLSSTRLPGKALKDLGGKPVLSWVLSAMKNVKADAYYVATDYDSESQLKPIVDASGWQLFAGPCDDVLERFCLLIQKIGADTVVRATADNPFLFYDAAQETLDAFNRHNKIDSCDYLTLTGLPHGCGVEVFNAHSLLKAKENTNDPYDHEHVGPALYNHKDLFVSIFEPSSSRWNYPQLRTTIDTKVDYIRAQMIVDFLSNGKKLDQAYSTEMILSSFNNSYIKNMILLVPSVKKGRGTGHFHRCLTLAVQIKAVVYIPLSADLKEKDSLIEEYFSKGLKSWQILQDLPQKNEFSMILADTFALETELATKLQECAPLVALDEGSQNTQYCDYLLNVIPGLDENVKPNYSEPCFITVPKHVRTKPPCKNYEDIQTVLVCAGGEDPAGLVIPSAIAFARLGKKVTAVKPMISVEKSMIPQNVLENITFSEPIPNLREKLFEYDLVITHYGLTAWEASFAGCAIILLGTTPLHVSLAQKYGFACLKKSYNGLNEIQLLLKNIESLYPKHAFLSSMSKNGTLAQFVQNLASEPRLSCPVCHSSSGLNDCVVARTPTCTFRRCSNCGMIYISYTIKPDMAYTQSYFFDQYKNQYGKTYLEDFDSIKTQCIRRMSVIDKSYHFKRKSDILPTILDIGCAYGPFLSAASDSKWKAFGTDVSEDAINYVCKTLKLPATCASFPNFNPSKEFGLESFDAVTMWYVIEHFKNLDEVLKTVSSIVKPNGIFAFSTPSASGVSRKFNTEAFFEQSPSDHFTLWEPQKVKSILSRYGFKVVKIISTGHHPKRFPWVKKYEWKKGSIPYTLVSILSHLFNLGDTFEVYCKKNPKSW